MTRPTRKPEWLRIKMRHTKEYQEVSKLIHGKKLHTVCEEAMCPNIHECWGCHKTATFIILGEHCTRACRFCAVKTGKPLPPDPDEPRRVAESVQTMQLRHAVITMVTRDDLPDGGAAIVAQTVNAIQALTPDCTTEVLVSDMQANPDAIRTIAESLPTINSHNIETVRSLSPKVRSNSDYDRSLHYLAYVKAITPNAITKSSLMLGLGETHDEILQSLDDLRSVDVDIVNLGQYLQPTKKHVPVEYYWTPDEFAELKKQALQRGFIHCESAPFVRSSYHAGAQYDQFLRELAKKTRQQIANTNPQQTSPSIQQNQKQGDACNIQQAS
jgi:lipoic acid synthetase